MKWGVDFRATLLSNVLASILLFLLGSAVTLLIGSFLHEKEFVDIKKRLTAIEDALTQSGQLRESYLVTHGLADNTGANRLPLGTIDATEDTFHADFGPTTEDKWT